MRQDLSIQKLINKEITSHISITDADVDRFYNANKASFNLAEPQVHLAQILVTPTPDAQRAQPEEQQGAERRRGQQKIARIQARLHARRGFRPCWRTTTPRIPNYRAQRRRSGFHRRNPRWRRPTPSCARWSCRWQPGALSPIINTQEGYRIFKMISKEPAGQRELNDPRVQQTIRETLLNRKDQLLKTAYYEVARNEAKVVNYLARSIAESAGKTGK